MDALKYIWEGAIPLQIHLHESEVTTVPPPPPAMVLAPRIGYLPLLASQIKPYFGSTLPPGVDTIWFEYQGLPLKWNIPTGVLFDLLCAEPERPWNLTVHFRGYPRQLLIPCEGEDSIKWSFINSLKEADYIINGNTKNVMSMSEPDLLELWRSVSNVDLEAYLRISSKLKLGGTGHEHVLKSISTASLPAKSTGEMDIAQLITGRIPVRLYVRNLGDDFDHLEDAPPVNNWDDVSYINRPVEIREEGKCFTLHDAVRSLLPELFAEKGTTKEESTNVPSEGQSDSTEQLDCTKTEEGGSNFSEEYFQSYHPSIKLVRIQGIEPKGQIPFSWVVNNLMNPEYFLHICVFVSVQ
ncbi:autophagy protein 5 isoform X2 [Cucumis sativus]|uniref:autophagy protein 5 isoform X2 n=1 Tax=Cucumis sativus TaxID=3659 RepID=UPI0002B444A2|nr:autophagy protein 5 isoform X2 [Cucumis sativus]